ncbi:MAG TPA: ATP-binding protein [Dyella sp.]|uniref:ATP-binding protein n=1 Tax=Dyella sp. TaxID=1869338 RepID=UPI002BCEBA82|nr:ATP-binding protein [Dyella sp.]HTV84068.1 ATP-binding protein [Dyella sp.]
MAKGNRGNAANEALFEEDYVLRTLGKIGYDGETALTELVANAWDAGASRVSIIIPEDAGSSLTVEDDGHGMTADNFRARWMKLGYNRIKNQGSGVEFPPERADQHRIPFGRNGVGRHGLLCFASQYEVETWRGGDATTFVINTRNNPSPFYIERETRSKKTGHGTRLSVVVERHLPDPLSVYKILAGRFVHDPQFTVVVNGRSVPLAQHEGLLNTEVLRVGSGSTVVAHIVDTTKAAQNTRYQGIAFWVNRRLVGTPRWAVGTTPVLDGRSRFAKRYAVVIEADGTWAPFVEQDWLRFKAEPEVDRLFSEVASYVHRQVEALSASFVEENSEDALMRNREEFRNLPTGAKVEVAQFTHALVADHPSIAPEALAKAVRAVIQLQSGRGGIRLLDKLMHLDETDIEGLDRLLEQWTVQDALVVLDEIDARLSVISAIEKLAKDPATDELHTLHPLITQARWLFGPEFDSSEYASNSTLRTVAEEVFGSRKADTTFQNPRRRPDLVILNDATISLTATTTFNGTDHLACMRDVLLIELKKGHSTIGRVEMQQAEGYIEDLMSNGALASRPFFHAYVVGHEIAQATTRTKSLGEGQDVFARIQATTYGQLTDTANRRLMNLKERIPSRYEEVNGYDLVQKVMGQPSQAPLIPSDAE